MRSNKKQLPLTEPKTSSTSAGLHGWGGETKMQRTPSGVKIKFTEDEEGILKYMGQKDITELVADATKPVIYLCFHDGRRFVTLPMCHALSDPKTFTSGYWYYILNQSDIPMAKGNDMHDFAVIQLGVDGEEIKVPPRISESLTLILNEPNAEALNYSRLNYPLRTPTTLMPKEVKA